MGTIDASCLPCCSVEDCCGNEVPKHLVATLVSNVEFPVDAPCTRFDGVSVGLTYGTVPVAGWYGQVTAPTTNCVVYFQLVCSGSIWTLTVYQYDSGHSGSISSSSKTVNCADYTPDPFSLTFPVITIYASAGEGAEPGECGCEVTDGTFGAVDVHITA